MSDPIGALRSAIGSGVGQAGGIDGAKRYIVDIGKGDGAKSSSFGDTLTQMINQVSDAQDTSAELTQKFLRGEPVELHQVMAAGEEAGLALELMVELRNKFTDAYRALVNMQS
jgi:flagellar hook-basal body complex protein FliE